MKVSEYHTSGFNCGESMIKKYNTDFGKNIPISICSGMGTGCTVGSLCGAINAGVIIIGFEKGREVAGADNPARALTNKFVTELQKKFGSEICKNLKANKIKCDDIMDFAYEKLLEILK